MVVVDTERFTGNADRYLADFTHPVSGIEKRQLSVTVYTVSVLGDGSPLTSGAGVPTVPINDRNIGSAERADARNAVFTFDSMPLGGLPSAFMAEIPALPRHAVVRQAQAAFFDVDGGRASGDCTDACGIVLHVDSSTVGHGLGRFALVAGPNFCIRARGTGQKDVTEDAT